MTSERGHKGGGSTSGSNSKPSLTFVLDTNLGLPTDREPWSDFLKSSGIVTESTTDLVHIDQALDDGGPDIAYVPGADFCRMIIQKNEQYAGLVIATSKFTGHPEQRTLLVVKKDDPATSLEDLAGSMYGYMNKSCSSSYFPPAIMLQERGKSMADFWQGLQVPGWQNRVDQVIAGKIRSTMILEDVWKMTPGNVDQAKVIGQYEPCPPAILIVRKGLNADLMAALRTHLLDWKPE